ncbi:MAG: NAD(P)-dependent oxidoreductase [Isosphaeraceae bacterium]
MAAPQLRIAVTADFYTPDGQPRYRDLGFAELEADPAIDCRPLAEHRPAIGPDQLEGADAVIVLTPRVTAETVSRAGGLLAVARFGVGYDSVDVPACTAADVLVLIASGAVDRSVAEATVAWMLALTHRVRAKDRLLREGRWDERSGYMGTELRDRVLGVIGLGGIGRALVRLLDGFGMARPLAFDPHVDPVLARSLGVRLVELDELLTTSDFVSIHCPLTESTRGLLGEREIGLMKRSAYLINTARGGIVDEDALYRALEAGRIAGAAIDCFEHEPVTSPHRLASLPNVLLAPHCIAWTDELFRDIGRAVSRGLLALRRGERPAGVINPEVFEHPGFQQKWSRWKAGGRP